MTKITSNWRYLLVLGLFVRLSLLLLVFKIPIMFGPSPPISPLHYQTGIDVSEYLKNSEFYFSLNNFSQIAQIFRDVYVDFTYPTERLLGPIYPLVLKITNYNISNTIPLSLLVFTCEAFCFSLWAIIFNKKMESLFGLLFIFMPHPIWFSIVVSSDIFLYFFSTLYFFCIIKKVKPQYSIIFLCFLLLLTKPTGIAYCIAALFLPQTFFSSTFSSRIYRSVLIMLSAIFTLVYLPYFLVDQTYINQSIELTQISRHNFELTKLIVKIFHIFGFNPSESGILLNELIRYFYGTIFIVGAVYILKKELWLKILLFITIGFILFTHVPTWRYLLPFFPILLFYGCEAIHILKEKFLGISLE